MFNYTIVLKATVTIEGINFIAYPVIDRRTNTADKAIVEQAVVNRYIRDNHGTLSNVEVVRTSVSRVGGGGLSREIKFRYWTLEEILRREA